MDRMLNLSHTVTNAASSTKKGIKSSNAKAARGTIEGTAFKGLLPTGMSGLGASSDTLDKSSSNVMRGKGTLPGGMNTLPPKGSSAGPTTGTEEAGSPTKKKGSSPLKKS